MTTTIAPDTGVSGPSHAADDMPALTGVRLPLALWVVSHHLSGPGRPLEPVMLALPPLASVVDAAAVALGTFFAISGFVLARRYRTTDWTRPNIVRYGIARLARVYPLYLLSLLIVAPFIRASMSDAQVGTPGDRASALFAYVFLLQGWDRPPVNWNTPAWSLSCEVFFYACFPLLAPLVRRLAWSRVLLTLVVAFGLPIVLRMSGVPLTLKPLIYFGDFLVGVGAAGLFDLIRQRRLSLPRVGPWLYGPAFVAVIVLLLAPGALGSFYLFDTGLRLSNCLLVLGLASGGGLAWRALSSRLLVTGGQASYAIYILHIPVLWWYERSDTYHALPAMAGGVVYVAIVLALSLAVARWYEAPANVFVRRRLSQGHRMRAGAPMGVRVSRWGGEGA